MLWISPAHFRRVTVCRVDVKYCGLIWFSMPPKKTPRLGGAEVNFVVQKALAEAKTVVDMLKSYRPAQIWGQQFRGTKNGRSAATGECY
jgi:hypothetical protein